MLKKAVPVVLVLVVLAAGAVYFALKSGIGGADDWVVRRVVRIAETYIRPKIDFQDFEWDGSRTITLKGVTLTADDGTEVVNAGAMTIVTERVPVAGGAFIIESIELKDATLRLIQRTKPDGSIEFKGLIPFTRNENITNQDRVDEDVKLSESFKIRLINLENGGFEYDAGDGSQPMVLRGITLDVTLNPGVDGSYALNTELKRDRIFDLVVKGDLNLDTITLANTDLTFDADLETEEAMSALPPQVQSLLRQYELRGLLTSKITGDLVLTDPFTSTVAANLRLIEGNLALGEYRFPIDRATINASLSEHRLDVSEFNVATIGGTIDFTRFTADLGTEGWPADLALDVQGLDIQRLLRAQPTEDNPPKFAGILTLTTNAAFNVQDLGDAFAGTLAKDRISGEGELTLRQGRLVSIPVLSDLIDAMDVVAAVTGTATNKDKADITFTLDGKGIKMPDKGLTIDTQLAGVRGEGRINYDQTLDLSVNAGPIEKLQEGLGGIGDILGGITDALVKYVIKGTTNDPTIEIKPLGIGA